MPQSFADALIDIIEDVREEGERDNVGKVLETANKVGRVQALGAWAPAGAPEGAASEAAAARGPAGATALMLCWRQPNRAVGCGINRLNNVLEVEPSAPTPQRLSLVAWMPRPCRLLRLQRRHRPACASAPPHLHPTPSPPPRPAPPRRR